MRRNWARGGGGGGGGGDKGAGRTYQAEGSRGEAEEGRVEAGEGGHEIVLLRGALGKHYRICEARYVDALRHLLLGNPRPSGACFRRRGTVQAGAWRWHDFVPRLLACTG